MFMSSVRVFLRPSVRDVVSMISMICVIDFHQTFVSCTSWDKDELIMFWGQKVKGQGPSVTI